MPIIIELFEEFAKRQGVPYFAVDNGRRFVFKNGASSTGRFHAEPPTDRAALLKVLVQYYKAKTEYGETNFRKRRDTINEKGEFARLQAGPAPAESDVEALQKFRDYVMEARADLQKHRTELNKLLGIDREAEARERQRELDTVTNIVQRAATVQI